MASPSRTGLTVADLERFDHDDRHRYELVGGELFVSPRGVPRHQYVATVIAARLVAWADANGGAAFAEQDVHYSDRDYVVPDAILLGPATVARLTGAVDVAPDLVVEVSSPSTRSLDLVVKRALYERRGAPEYWFVDLDAEQVQVYRLVGGRYGEPGIAVAGDTLHPPHLDGLAVAVDDVLRPLPWPGGGTQGH